jgi:hypothetical protein
MRYHFPSLEKSGVGSSGLLNIVFPKTIWFKPDCIDIVTVGESLRFLRQRRRFAHGIKKSGATSRWWIAGNYMIILAQLPFRLMRARK